MHAEIHVLLHGELGQVADCDKSELHYITLIFFVNKQPQGPQRKTKTK